MVFSTRENVGLNLELSEHVFTEIGAHGDSGA